MSDTWLAQYRDPRWQRRRLEIFQRANFTCEYCQRTDLPLHVHHGIYRKGHAQWEYEDFELHCLCEECHHGETARSQVLKEWICRMDRDQFTLLYEFAGWVLYGQNQNN